MSQIVCQKLSGSVCFSVTLSHFFHGVCAHVLYHFCVCVCWAEELSCTVHSGFTLAPVLPLWQQIPLTPTCQLSAAFHTTCNICLLLTRVTTVSKAAWAAKYQISLDRRENTENSTSIFYVVFLCFCEKPTFYCVRCSKVWLQSQTVVVFTYLTVWDKKECNAKWLFSLRIVFCAFWQSRPSRIINLF